MYTKIPLTSVIQPSFPGIYNGRSEMQYSDRIIRYQSIGLTNEYLHTSMLKHGMLANVINLMLMKCSQVDKSYTIKSVWSGLRVFEQIKNKKLSIERYVNKCIDNSLSTNLGTRMKGQTNPKKEANEACIEGKEVRLSGDLPYS